MACLARDPDERPASSTEVLARLDEIDDAGDWGQAEARAWWKRNEKTLGLDDAARGDWSSPDDATEPSHGVGADRG